MSHLTNQTYQTYHIRKHAAVYISSNIRFLGHTEQLTKTQLYHNLLWSTSPRFTLPNQLVTFTSKPHESEACLSTGWITVTFPGHRCPQISEFLSDCGHLLLNHAYVTDHTYTENYILTVISSTASSSPIEPIRQHSQVFGNTGIGGNHICSSIISIHIDSSRSNNITSRCSNVTAIPSTAPPTLPPAPPPLHPAPPPFYPAPQTPTCLLSLLTAWLWKNCSFDLFHSSTKL